MSVVSVDILGRKRSAKVDEDRWGPPLKPQRCKKSALACLPFQYLPRSLYPRPKSCLCPPVFHYGYAVTRDWVCSYGAEHNLLCIVPKPTYQNETMVSIIGTVTNMSEYILEKTQIKSFTLRYRYVKALTEHGYGQHLISICSNYRPSGCDEVPKVEDIKKLKDFLSFSEPPGWYVDYLNWRWTWREVGEFRVFVT